MKRVMFLGMVFLVPLAFSAQGEAKTWVNETHQISLDLDEAAGWTDMGPMPEQHVLLQAVVPAISPTKSLMVIAQPVGASIGPLDHRVILGFLQRHQSAMQKHGGKTTLLSQRSLEMAGVPAYEATFQSELDGLSFQELLRLILANDTFYTLQVQSKSGDPGADPQVQRVLDSFRFTEKPRLPAPGQVGLSASPNGAYLMRLGKIPPIDAQSTMWQLENQNKSHICNTRNPAFHF